MWPGSQGGSPRTAGVSKQCEREVRVVRVGVLVQALTKAEAWGFSGSSTKDLEDVLAEGGQTSYLPQIDF